MLKRTHTDSTQEYIGRWIAGGVCCWLLTVAKQSLLSWRGAWETSGAYVLCIRAGPSAVHIMGRLLPRPSRPAAGRHRRQNGQSCSRSPCIYGHAMAVPARSGWPSWAGRKFTGHSKSRLRVGPSRTRDYKSQTRSEPCAAARGRSESCGAAPTARASAGHSAISERTRGWKRWRCHAAHSASNFRNQNRQHPKSLEFCALSGRFSLHHALVLGF